VNSGIEKINLIISECQVIIGYEPLLDEIDYLNFPLLVNNRQKEIILLPVDKKSDPSVWAEKCKKQTEGKKVCLFIPGRQFDSLGTRHGRGGGWYDRFLSAIPCDWVRIGITDVKHFSAENLIRRAWDEPMDWVIVYDGFSWQVYETKAGE
jgi:hypothetical protein